MHVLKLDEARITFNSVTQNRPRALLLRVSNGRFYIFCGFGFFSGLTYGNFISDAHGIYVLTCTLAGLT